MLQLMGAKTQIDLQSLVAVSHALPKLLGHDTAGQVAKAGPSWQPVKVDTSRSQKI
jgi:hydroxymethylglutaryl-CoA lyase